MQAIPTISVGRHGLGATVLHLYIWGAEHRVIQDSDIDGTT